MVLILSQSSAEIQHQQNEEDQRKLVFQEQDKLLKPYQIEKTVSVFGVVLVLNFN